MFGELSDFLDGLGSHLTDISPVELLTLVPLATLIVVFGVLTALAFAIWPLGRVHDTPVSTLFREAITPERSWPRRSYVLLTALVILKASRA